MNKRLNKYIENNSELNNLKPWRNIPNDNPIDYIEEYFRRYTPATFFNDGSLQCTGNCNRSFVDIYMLTKARFKDITIEEVAYIITYVLCHVNESSSGFLASIKCPQIKKVVFKMDTDWWDSFTDKNSISGYGSARTVGSDGLSYNSILSMANKWIKKQNKLQNNG